MQGDARAIQIQEILVTLYTLRALSEQLEQQSTLQESYNPKIPCTLYTLSVSIEPLEYIPIYYVTYLPPLLQDTS